MILAINWIWILLIILRLIAEGKTREEAVSHAASKSGVDPEDIWERGGF